MPITTLADDTQDRSPSLEDRTNSSAMPSETPSSATGGSSVLTVGMRMVAPKTGKGGDGLGHGTDGTEADEITGTDQQTQ